MNMTWLCVCGTENAAKFCQECGTKKTEDSQSWTCVCGTENVAKFCQECGTKKIATPQKEPRVTPSTPGTQSPVPSEDAPLMERGPEQHRVALKQRREEISKYKRCVFAAACQTVGLKSDSTVVAVGNNDLGQCNTGGWYNIFTVALGNNHTVGLKLVDRTVEGRLEFGTVVAVGKDDDGQCNTGAWHDIYMIAAGFDHIVGWKVDGTVVAIGNNKDRQCNTSDWRDICAIAAGENHTVGLKTDGTVVAVGSNGDGRCDTDNWHDIVAIAAGAIHTVG